MRSKDHLRGAVTCEFRYDKSADGKREFLPNCGQVRLIAVASFVRGYKMW
jgi:hypothetical protein